MARCCGSGLPILAEGTERSDCRTKEICLTRPCSGQLQTIVGCRFRTLAQRNNLLQSLRCAACDSALNLFYQSGIVADEIFCILEFVRYRNRGLQHSKPARLSTKDRGASGAERIDTAGVQVSHVGFTRPDWRDSLMNRRLYCTTRLHFVCNR